MPAMKLHTISIIAVGCALFLPQFAFATGDSVVIDNWLDEEYAGLLDTLLPTEGGSLDLHTTIARVTIRIVPSGDNPSERELLFTIDQRADKSRQLSVIFPGPESIYLQLRRLKNDHPDWTRQMFVDAVRLYQASQQASGSSRYASCVRDIVEAKVDLVPELPMFMHGTAYSIVAVTATGDLKFTLTGPGGESPRQPARILKLIECVRHAVEKDMMNRLPGQPIMK